MKFTVATVSFTKKCQLSNLHPPQISPSGKCHCVIITSDNKRYWIHSVNVKVSAQDPTVTYMHQSQPSLLLLLKHLTVHLQLSPSNHLIWCNATLFIIERMFWRVVLKLKYNFAEINTSTVIQQWTIRARKVEGHGGISRSEIERTLSNVGHRNCCKVISIYVRAYVRYLLFNHSFVFGFF